MQDFPCNHVEGYLKAVFGAGENSGRKLSAADVAKNMRVCRDVEGQKIRCFILRNIYNPAKLIRNSPASCTWERHHTLIKKLMMMIYCQQYP